MCVRQRVRETKTPLETPNGMLRNYSDKDWIKRTTEDASKRITFEVFAIPTEVLITQHQNHDVPKTEPVKNWII
jgi:hypothetical protein